jgi:hypothetical protein
MNTALSRKFLRAALVLMLSIGCASVALAAKPALVQEQANLEANIVSGTLGLVSNPATPSPLYTVPNGSVFVLETLSLGAYENTLTTFRVLVIAANSPTAPFLAFSPQPINTTPSQTASFGTYSVTARFPPGTTLSVLYQTADPAGGATTGNAALSFFGHLEPQ